MTLQPLWAPLLGSLWPMWSLLPGSLHRLSAPLVGILRPLWPLLFRSLRPPWVPPFSSVRLRPTSWSLRLSPLGRLRDDTTTATTMETRPPLGLREYDEPAANPVRRPRVMPTWTFESPTATGNVLQRENGCSRRPPASTRPCEGFIGDRQLSWSRYRRPSKITPPPSPPTWS